MLIVRVLPEGPTYECEAILQDENGGMVLFTPHATDNPVIYQECSVTPAWNVLDEEEPCIKS